MRILFREFIPPIIIRAIDRSKYIISLNQKYEVGYENEKLINLIIEKNLLIKRNIVFSHIDENYFRTISAIGFADSNNSTMRVLDFGGGAGHHLEIARSAFPGKNFLWTIVETPALVNAANLRIQDEALDFVSSIETISRLEYFDIVHSNSAVQYTENPLVTIESLFAINSPVFFLTRVPLNLKERHIEYIQVSNMAQNGPGKTSLDFKNSKIGYVTKIPSKSNVEKLLIRLDFKFQFLDEGPWDVVKFGSSVRTFTLIAHRTSKR